MKWIRCNYTDEEQITRVWDFENIKQLMHRRAFYESNDKRREELEKLWVQKADNRRSASLATNNGYYVGLEEIAKFYVHQFTQTRYEQLKPYCDADPALKSCADNLGFGIMELHTCNTPMIYIADDGRTAKFLGYDCGQYTIGKPDGSVEPYVIFGLYYADLMKEGDQWKIWHLRKFHDHTIDISGYYSDLPAEHVQGTDPLEDILCGVDHTIPMTVYDPFFGWEDLPDILPRPYYTFEENKGYGPGSMLED